MKKRGEILTSKFMGLLIAIALLLVLILILLLAFGKGDIILDRFDNFWRIFT